MTDEARSGEQRPSARRNDERRGVASARARPTASTVLVVDDMEDNRDLVAMILERLGLTVHVAVDGFDAIEHARADHPTIIVMDLAMPNLDGFEATRRIRAIPELASVPILALSAFTDRMTIERALAAGCTDILAKPCTPERLVECVERALGAQFHTDGIAPPIG